MIWKRNQIKSKPLRFLCLCSWLFGLFVSSISLGGLINSRTESTKYETYSRAIESKTNDGGFLYKFSLDTTGEDSNHDVDFIFLTLFEGSNFIQESYSAQPFLVDPNNTTVCVSSDSLIEESVPFIGIHNLSYFIGAEVLTTKFAYRPSGIRCSVSYNLAKKLLGINNNNDLESTDLNNIPNLSFDIVVGNTARPLLIYSIIKPTDSNTIYDYLGDDFIVFHDVEISISNAYYYLYCLPGIYLNMDVLENFSSKGYFIGDKLSLLNIKGHMLCEDISSSVIKSYCFVFNFSFAVSLIIFSLVWIGLLFSSFFFYLENRFDFVSFVSLALVYSIVYYLLTSFAIHDPFLGSSLNNYWWVVFILIGVLFIARACRRSIRNWVGK